MIDPKDMPANAPKDAVVVVQSARIESTFMIATARLRVVDEMIKEVLADVPGADWIEVRAVRYDTRKKEDT